ncbi:MAG: hypothetical protein AAGH70_05635 [Pseudomonadota bacterium]
MAETVLTAAGRACRRVAVGLIARAFPRDTLSDVEARIARHTVPRQVLIVGGVLSLLFAGFYVAAQFGWIGLALFIVAVVFLVG